MGCGLSHPPRKMATTTPADGGVPTGTSTDSSRRQSQPGLDEDACDQSGEREMEDIQFITNVKDAGTADQHERSGDEECDQSGEREMEDIQFITNVKDAGTTDQHERSGDEDFGTGGTAAADPGSAGAATAVGPTDVPDQKRSAPDPGADERRGIAHPTVQDAPDVSSSPPGQAGLGLGHSSDEQQPSPSARYHEKQMPVPPPVAQPSRDRSHGHGRLARPTARPSGDGAYSILEANPGKLQDAMLGIKQSLEAYACLREVQGKWSYAASHANGASAFSTELRQPGDWDFVVQKRIARKLFFLLWTKDAFNRRCTPSLNGKEDMRGQRTTDFRHCRQLETALAEGTVFQEIWEPEPRSVHPICRQDVRWLWDIVARACSNVNGEPPSLTKEEELHLFDLAVKMWIAFLLTFCFESPATMFWVPRGDDFVPAYMTSVVMFSKERRMNQKVAFTVLPGFRVGQSVIKSHVYLV